MPTSCRILLAEDNPTNQKVALLQLRKIGFQAETANNGTEVLRLCRDRVYDIILMDCQMPELDGYETTRILRDWQRSDPPKMPGKPRIIALTANALKGDRDKCLAAGMDDYIAKPVTLNELRDVLVRNWPGAAGPVIPVAEGPKRELVDLERFNSVSRDASGAMDPDAFEIFRGAMTELPARWERMAKLSGSDLVKDAHNLKGMVSVFGFSALADELARLEREASTLNADQVVERVSSIRSLCADSLVELGRLVPEIAG